MKDRFVARMIGLPMALAFANVSASETLDKCYAQLAGEQFALADRCAVDSTSGDAAARLLLRREILAWGGEAKPDVLQPLRAAGLAASDAPRWAERFDITEAQLKPDLERAFTLARDALTQAEARGDARAIAEARFDLAETLSLRHDRDAAPAALLAAAQAWHAQAGGHARWHEFAALRRLGALAQHAGHFDAAAAHYAQAADLAANAFGADSVARLRSDLQRSHQYEELGRYRDELDLRREVLARARRALGDAHPVTADAEAQLASALAMLGDYAAARPHYENAERILEHTPDIPWRTLAVTLNNFANSLQESGDLDGALRRERRILELAGDKPGSERMRAVVMANRGNTEFAMDRLDAAKADFTQALALREKADGANSPGIAFSLEGLGSVALARADYAQAEGYFRRVLALREPGLAPDHPLLGRSRYAVALARWGQGDLEGAFIQAVAIARAEQRVLAHLATEFVERQSVSYRDQLVPATALVVTLAQQRGDAASLATAWELTMRQRGLISRNEARRLAAARAGADPALQTAWQDWRKANAAYAEGWSGKGTDAAALDALRTAAENTEQQLWDRVGNVAAASQDVPTPAQLAAALPPSAQLLALAEGLAPNPSQMLKADNRVGVDWYAFELRAGGAPTLRRLGDAGALAADARAWYAALRDPGSDVRALRARGGSVRKQLLGTDQTPVAHSLYVVPLGDLYRVNLAALPDGDGFLVERGVDVHTLAHESDLLLGAAPREGGRVLLAGAPDFPAATPGARRQVCASAPEQGFTRLASAERELDDLHTLFDAAATPMTDLRGAAATREGVLRALPAARVAHLATHGFSLDASCSAATTRAVTLEPVVPIGGSTPALSGLAFSGAKFGAGTSPIGVVSAGDLVALDLSKLDWVALSACDSGLGPIGRDEGVFGMRRALRLAGARTVVMSLWEVDDAATAPLMRALYQARFGAHRDVPGAMGDAMRATLAQRRGRGESVHPYYWAAFVSEGGWR